MSRAYPSPVPPSAFSEFVTMMGEGIYNTPWYIWFGIITLAFFFGVPQVLWNMMLSVKKNIQDYADSFKPKSNKDKTAKPAKTKKFQLCDDKGTPIKSDILFRQQQPSSDAPDN